MAGILCNFSTESFLAHRLLSPHLKLNISNPKRNIINPEISHGQDRIIMGRAA